MISPRNSFSLSLSLTIIIINFNGTHVLQLVIQSTHYLLTTLYFFHSPLINDYLTSNPWIAVDCILFYPLSLSLSLAIFQDARHNLTHTDNYLSIYIAFVLAPKQRKTITTKIPILTEKSLNSWNLLINTINWSYQTS